MIALHFDEDATDGDKLAAISTAVGLVAAQTLKDSGLGGDLGHLMSVAAAVLADVICFTSEETALSFEESLTMGRKLLDDFVTQTIAGAGTPH